MKAMLLLSLSLMISSEAAAQSGLLLGLRSDSGYRTLWIAPINQKVQLVHTLPGIVVPRGDAFWRFDVATSCEMTTGQDVVANTVFVNVFKMLTRHILDAPKFIDRSCAAALDSLRRAPDDSTWAKIDSTAFGWTEEDQCVLRDQTITFVSPRYVSVNEFEQTTEFCNPAKYSSSTYRSVTNWNEKSINLLDHLPREQRRELIQRWQANKNDCVLASPDYSWLIERGMGRWEASVAGESSSSCYVGEDPPIATIPLPLPLARAEPAQWLALLRKTYPQLKDAFVSPRADLVFARVGDTIYAHNTSGKTIGHAVWAHQLRGNEQVVSAEWATGTHVQRWTMLLRP